MYRCMKSFVLTAVPVHKSDETRSGVVLSRDDALYSQKDPHGNLGGE